MRASSTIFIHEQTACWPHCQLGRCARMGPFQTVERFRHGYFRAMALVLCALLAPHTCFVFLVDFPRADLDAHVVVCPNRGGSDALSQCRSGCCVRGFGCLRLSLVRAAVMM
jgi:hypothetical protein